MRLENKIAIVTGAAQGIGRGITDRFTNEAAKVALVDYQKDVDVDPAQGQSFYHGDVSDPELWDHLITDLLAEYGRIDVLVNNAGIIHNESVHEVELERWNRALAVNLTGVMLGMRAVIPALREQGGGSIINLSSIWGSVAAGGAASYQATKAGVHHLTNNAAVTYYEPAADFDERHFQLMFEVLVRAPLELAQRVLPGMRSRRRGWILNISSRAAIHPQGPPFSTRPGGAVYGMCKAALERMATGFAAEVYSDGIAVNALSPSGLVPTPGVLHHGLTRGVAPERLEAPEYMAEAAHALQRIGRGHAERNPGTVLRRGGGSR